MKAPTQAERDAEADALRAFQAQRCRCRCCAWTSISRRKQALDGVHGVRWRGTLSVDTPPTSFPPPLALIGRSRPLACRHSMLGIDWRVENPEFVPPRQWARFTLTVTPIVRAATPRFSGSHIIVRARRRIIYFLTLRSNYEYVRVYGAPYLLKHERPTLKSLKDDAEPVNVAKNGLDHF